MRRLWSGPGPPRRPGPPGPPHQAGPAGPDGARHLAVRELTKHFGPVTACSRISLDVRPGEIVGLLGQNGAGKTTLMNLIAGLDLPDSGEVTLGGVALRPGHAADARASGIAMVHQEFSLIDALTVWENVALVNEGRLSRRSTAGRIQDISESFGLDMSVHLDTPGRLSPAMRQRVEIIKCLVQEPRLILLDEPTAILSREEASRLFGILRRLISGQHASVVISNHRLAEVLGSTDRIVVLRVGALVADLPTAQATERTLAVQMLGENLAGAMTEGDAGALKAQGNPSTPAGPSRPRPASAGGTDQAVIVGAGQPHSLDGVIRPEPPVMPAEPAAAAAATDFPGVTPALQIVDLRAVGAGAPALDGLSLTVGPGEIVGLAGVEGNGQTELMDILGNRARASSGSVLVGGRRFRVSHGQRLRGLGLVPADRHRHGCVLDMSVAENLSLGQLSAVSRGHFVSLGRMRRRAAGLIEQYGIKCADPGVPLRFLSGGHQQRVILARELSRDPAVLVADQPTRGLDVAAVQAVWASIRDVAGQGMGVLLNSSDLDELLQLATRVVVIVRGRNAGEVDPATVDAEALGLLMGGVDGNCAA